MNNESQTTQTGTTTNAVVSHSTQTSSEALQAYYKRLFPIKKLFSWLSLENNDYFQRREFSHTIDTDLFTRYRTFNNAEAWRQALIKEIPSRIEIGAVFNQEPKKTAFELKPVEKELVFDIDINDYGDIRTCCIGSNVCTRCWIWIDIAGRVLDDILKEDFGFSHILWVFSGRRGIHCWVSDSRAKNLSNASREAILSWISVVSGGSNKDLNHRVKLGLTLHPTLERIYTSILETKMESVIKNQGLLKTLDSLETFLLFLPPDCNLAPRIRDHWKSTKDIDPVIFWKNSFVATVKHEMNKPNLRWNTDPIYNIVFTYTYPRLDVGVTKSMNHLLKCPFVVHPDTGKICVPFEPWLPFDPNSVPKLQDLYQDLSLDVQANDKLKPYFDLFEKFLGPLLENHRLPVKSLDF